MFDDEEIIVTEATTAEDIEDWDSLMHISLIASIEDEFKTKFSMEDIKNMKNIGEMVSRIAYKK